MSDKKRKGSRTSLEAVREPGQATKPQDGKSKLDERANQAPIPDLSSPAELPPLAREEWNRIVSELIASGILSKFDRGPLAIYCGAHGMLVDKSDFAKEKADAR